MQKKHCVGNVVRTVIFIICISVFIYCVAQIIDRYRDLSHAEDVYNEVWDKYAADVPEILPPIKIDIENGFATPNSGQPNLGEIDDTNTNPSQPDDSEHREYLILQSIVLGIQNDYPECYGYITVSGTNISYPVMKSRSGNDYYLRHLYNGDYSKAGSIFCDYMMSDNYDDNLNAVVYGHDMTNGSMFRAIKEFFDNPDKAEQAKTMEITFVTANRVYVYSFCAGYRSEEDYYIAMFNRNTSDKSDFSSFIKKIKSSNIVPFQRNFTDVSRIITLVTCTNISSRPNERYVIRGVLTKCYILG